jgi:hypothetical protein
MIFFFSKFIFFPKCLNLRQNFPLKKKNFNLENFVNLKNFVNLEKIFNLENFVNLENFARKFFST